MAGSRARSESGFSLVELMVVVMIIGSAISSISGCSARGQVSGSPLPSAAPEPSRSHAAHARIRNAIAAANVAYNHTQDYTLVTASLLNLLEPSLKFVSSSASPSSNRSDRTINYQVTSPTRIVMGVEAVNGNCYYAQDNKSTTGANRGSTFMDGPSALGAPKGCTALDADPADPQLGVDDVDWDDEL